MLGERRNDIINKTNSDAELGFGERSIEEKRLTVLMSMVLSKVLPRARLNVICAAHM